MTVDGDANSSPSGQDALKYSMPRSAKRAEAVETDDARRLRLAWESERIAEARADIAAGRLVDSAEVDGWIESIGTDHELPIPYSGR
jgi:predicted transcriptional regulator